MKLLVFSHLRWDFVFQRPQHLLSRLARRHPVLFIEEPVHAQAAARLEEFRPMPHVCVLRPHTPVQAAGFHDDQLPFLKPLVEEHLERHGIDDYAIWFCTPMALPLMADLDPSIVVYDCMDELSAFRGAPRQMIQREAALLRRADLVLTGGPSLYEAKRHANPWVLCLPNAVDSAHFARDRALARTSLVARAAELQAGIAGPRLGYHGVIDERLDLALIERLADADPAWQLVMVGPVVKIDAATLPQRPNIHWLGHQPYELLPQLLASWEIALLPFALTASTRRISPTKTLEYLAAGRAVVSTAVQDVVSLYGHVVRVAEDHDGFIAACRQAFGETPAARRDRERRTSVTVARHSWDGTAQMIRQALDTAVRQAQTERLFRGRNLAELAGNRAA